jgi:hypothetical protein
VALPVPPFGVEICTVLGDRRFVYIFQVGSLLNCGSTISFSVELTYPMHCIININVLYIQNITFNGLLEE